MATPDDPNSDAYFRIGHMGHLNAHMVLGVPFRNRFGTKILEHRARERSPRSGGGSSRRKLAGLSGN